MSFPLIVDLAIIAALIFYAIDGYRRGFLLLALEFIGTFVAFYIAAVFASPAGALIANYITIPQPLQKAVGFVGLWILIQALYVLGSNFLYRLMPKQIRDSLINRAFGTIPSLAKGIIMVAIIATLIVALPIESQLRPAIGESRFGSRLVKSTQHIQQQLIKRYNKELTETLTFLTTTPLVPRIQEKGESLKLHFTTTKVTVDEVSEAEMLNFVNEERVKVGLKPLRADPAMREVARAHAKDMFARGYFSHDSPDGKDPFDRIREAGITYLTAGENLALAPTVELAHTGLMNSPKHKENILFPDFGRVGIGVIDGGIYGKMFVQEFRD